MNSQEASTGKIMVWIGIGSSILTILLTIINTITKTQIDSDQ